MTPLTDSERDRIAARVCDATVAARGQREHDYRDALREIATTARTALAGHGPKRTTALMDIGRIANGVLQRHL